DREETKRLLYVAMTRARDKLYLVSEAKDGRFKPWGGSLGDVLPATFRPRFESAAAIPPPASVEWIGASGRLHTLRVCPPCEKICGNLTVRTPLAAADSASDNFAALADPCALPRVSVTEALGIAPARVEAMRSDETGQRLAGILVHRLFERHGTALAVRLKPDATSSPMESGAVVASGFSRTDDLTEELRRLLTNEELVEADDIEQLLVRARESYLALCGQPALGDVLKSGEPLFEVPFSVRAAGAQTILRGTFDCLVRRADGGVTVLEL